MHGALPYDPLSDSSLTDGAAGLARSAARHLAVHRCRRSNELSLARHSRDRGSFRTHHPFEHLGQRGRSRVARSIDRSPKALGGSPGGVNHLILRLRQLRLSVRVLRHYH